MMSWASLVGTVREPRRRCQSHGTNTTLLVNMIKWPTEFKTEVFVR